ncbi:MAG: hypothetical protein IKX44_10500 [Prevotella sp.]|nr:hypothetical protein [Prevotella sp.]
MKKFLLMVLMLVVTTVAATAQTVTTDKRFARGATMAFGRMTVTGLSSSQIAEQGFCYSTEKAEPTVDDQTTKSFLTNNGRIYWLKDLTPATKYYMRAYVKTKSGDALYGDVIKFYTIPKGEVKLSMRTSGDDNSNRIKAAAETAVEWWNNLTEIKDFTTNIGYNSGTPTAECSYGGWMSVGPNTSYQRCGTILHELLHGVGVIPWAGTQWSKYDLRSSKNGDGYGSGYWLGDRVTEVLSFWDNKDFEQLNGDYQHMWPYGINGAHEDNGTDVLYIGNGLICQALGEDGLEHTDKHFAEPYYAINVEDDVKYYLKNENEDRGFYTSYLVENEDGTLSWKEIALADLTTRDDAAWYITFTPTNQFYQLHNAKTGNYLYMTGSTAKTIATTSGNTDFHVMKARIDAADTHTDEPNPRGYWLLHHASRNPRALSAAANGRVATETFNISNNATTQRWLILTAEQAAEVDNVGMGAFRKQVADILSQLRGLRSVPHTEDTEGTDAKLDNIIDEIEGKSATATSAVQVAELVEEARQAVFDFLANATPTDMDQPFNVSLLIKNPGLDDTEGWLGVPTLSYSCGEFFEVAFDYNQTLENMPAGTYVLHAQAFQRAGIAETAYRAYINGTTTRISTFLYAGSRSERVHNICDYGQENKLGVGDEVAVGDPVIYIPNDMKSAANYFKQGFYDCEVATELTEDGSKLKIGIRCKNGNSSYWSIFDNFRLYYYGSIPLDVVTGIETQPITERKEAEATAIYDLSGRKVSSSSSELPKGIYIQNGRKFVVK